jgi:hypothetical protein
MMVSLSNFNELGFLPSNLSPGKKKKKIASLTRSDGEEQKQEEAKRSRFNGYYRRDRFRSPSRYGFICGGKRRKNRVFEFSIFHLLFFFFFDFYSACVL